jgi:hypothetical protein
MGYWKHHTVSDMCARRFYLSLSEIRLKKPNLVRLDARAECELDVRVPFGRPCLGRNELKIPAGTHRFLPRIGRPSLPDVQTGTSIRLGAGTPHTAIAGHFTLDLVTAFGAVGS